MTHKWKRNNFRSTPKNPPLTWFERMGYTAHVKYTNDERHIMSISDCPTWEDIERKARYAIKEIDIIESITIFDAEPKAVKTIRRKK